MRSKRPDVLVTGGAGYVGSHVVLALVDTGRTPLVVDNLITGHPELVPTGVPLIRGDAGDPDVLRRVSSISPEAVIHCAGSLNVAESIDRPAMYWRNNVETTRRLADAAAGWGARALVFSSSAAVYGEPDRIPVSEESPVRPITPYGQTKLAAEWLLNNMQAAGGPSNANLRYFNVAGADPNARSGEWLETPFHLMDLAVRAAVGDVDRLKIFGTDHPTPDGTCIRDYVHVTDLAAAHVDVLDHLLAGGRPATLNVGYGVGRSVREIVDAVARVSGANLSTEDAPPRAGDPVRLVADPSRLRNTIRWQPRFDDPDVMAAHALAFERLVRAREDDKQTYSEAVSR